MNRFNLITCSMVLALGACSSDDGGGAAETSDGGETSISGADSGTEDGGDTTTGPDDGGDDTTTGGADDTSGGSETTGSSQDCGNGEVEGDEQCDDGNEEDDDGCSSTCEVEPCGLLWEVRHGDGMDPSTAGDIALDSMGNIVATGFIDTSGDGPELWVAKFDATGTELWSKTVNGDGDDDYGNHIAIDDSDNILVVGRMTGTDGTADIFAGTWAADGTEGWRIDVAGAAVDDDLGTGAAFDANGNAIVTATIEEVAGDSDLWVRKLDTAGQELWTETVTYPGTASFSTDRGGTVTTDADGNVYAQAAEYIDYQTEDVHIIKYGPDGGAPLWDQAPLKDGGAHEHAEGDLEIDGVGDLVTSIVQYNPGWTLWLLKQDPADGTVVWQKNSMELVMAPSRHIIDGVGIDGSDNIVLGGTRDLQPGDFEAWVARVDSEGNVLCFGGYGELGNQLIPNGATSNTEGNVFIGGQFLDQEAQAWLAEFLK